MRKRQLLSGIIWQFGVLGLSGDIPTGSLYGAKCCGVRKCHVKGCAVDERQSSLLNKSDDREFTVGWPWWYGEEAWWTARGCLGGEMWKRTGVVTSLCVGFLRRH
jgi:hypothetical protein